MSKRSRAAYVLERMQVRDLSRVYVLGCQAPRVTVLSQQFRAFNLIWALFDAGRLEAGDRVGVVGGGIGGLTVAAAAMLKGCSVVLAEERQQLMHLQRRNTTRLLHPNIYEWPSPGAEESSTRFPCMNWTADLAGEVVARLDGEWAALAAKHRPEVHVDTCVTAVQPAGPDGRLVMRKHDEWMSDPCDAMVAAVGFGVEPSVPGLTLDSYWENDKLEQSARGGQAVKRVLVSGPGDGGCIDVLRLMYSNFQHAKFADAVARLRELDRYKKRLLDIDKAIPDSDPAGYLREEYSKLGLPANLAESLGTLRTDTHVVLNGPDPSPLSPNACILHRVAVWALVVAGKVQYRAGRIDKSAISAERVASGVKYFVPFPGAGRHGFDAVVIRHGPESCLTALPEVMGGYSGIQENAARDKTRRQMYPDDFYPARQLPPHAGRSSAATFSTTLSGGAPLGEGPALPLAAEPAVEPAGPTRLHATEPVTAVAALLADIELLSQGLAAETRAENYVPAAEVARALDALLTSPGPAVPPAAWRRGHKALCDFELFVRKRVESGGGHYDLGRLRDLVRRMGRGPE